VSANGATDTAQLELQMDKLKYGQIRKLRKLAQTDRLAAAEYGDELLQQVMPVDIDELPVLQALELIRRFQQIMEQGMSGKALSPAPSSAVSDAGESTTTPI
jgi:hypothetical protein